MSLKDVVVYDLDTERVELIAGRAILQSDQWQSVGRRMRKVGAGLPDSQGVASVPSDRYKVGDKLRDEDIP